MFSTIFPTIFPHLFQGGPGDVIWRLFWGCWARRFVRGQCPEGPNPPQTFKVTQKGKSDSVVDTTLTAKYRKRNPKETKKVTNTGKVHFLFTFFGLLFVTFGAPESLFSYFESWGVFRALWDLWPLKTEGAAQLTPLSARHL